MHESGARGAAFVPPSRLDDDDSLKASSSILLPEQQQDNDDHNDRYNYALLIALYTLQGIPMGLSASIPFLIQQKIKYLASLAVTDGASTAAWNANAIFALCSWPFSLKLLWAPIVDSIYCSAFGRRKS